MFQRIRSSGSLSAEVVSNIKEYGRPLAALFSLRPHSFLLRKKGIAAASEEASSIPFPPGRRKLHIRSLLLPSQIVTVSLGHNLAIWNFTTPHAILMMADIFLPVNRSEIFSYILPVFLRFVNGAEAAVYFAGPQRRSALLRQLRDGTEAIALRAQLVNRCQRRVHRAFVQIVH